MMMENKIFSKEKDYLPAMYFMPGSIHSQNSHNYNINNLYFHTVGLKNSDGKNYQIVKQ